MRLSCSGVRSRTHAHSELRSSESQSETFDRSIEKKNPASREAGFAAAPEFGGQCLVVAIVGTIAVIRLVVVVAVVRLVVRAIAVPVAIVTGRSGRRGERSGDESGTGSESQNGLAQHGVSPFRGCGIHIQS